MDLGTGLAMRNWFASLQFRLILAFTLVLALAFSSVNFYVGIMAQREAERFEQIREEARAARAAQVVSRFYSPQDGWVELQPALERAGPLSGGRLIVRDVTGRVVADSSPGFDRPAGTAGYFLPIEVGGRKVGSVQLSDTDAGNTIREPAVSRLASAVNRSLFWSGLLAVGGGMLLIGLLSRRILAPVQSLTAAAQQLGRGDLTQRVYDEAPGEIGQLASTFNAMAENLEKAEKQRRSLVADVAHELRTPLSNIQGYLEAVKDGLLQPDGKTIDIIYQQVVHVVQLVEDLRVLAMAESGTLRLHLESGSMEELLRQAVDAFRPRAEAKGVDLSVWVQPELPDVLMDRTRIAQVVANLLENAIFHTPEGGSVAVSARNSNSVLTVAVSDTGPGISSNDLDLVFERFYRVDLSRTRSTGGTGLGLTIAKQLIETHRGSVGVESSTDQGSRFYFNLPLGD
jgi:signal transduction histidine kinase